MIGRGKDFTPTGASLATEAGTSVDDQPVESGANKLGVGTSRWGCRGNGELVVTRTARLRTRAGCVVVARERTERRRGRGRSTRLPEEVA